MSTSGLKNLGKVFFEPIAPTTSNITHGNKGAISQREQCRMTLNMSFVVPRILSRLFNEGSKAEAIIRERILVGMLTRFRDVVLDDELKNTSLYAI